MLKNLNFAIKIYAYKINVYVTSSRFFNKFKYYICYFFIQYFNTFPFLNPYKDIDIYMHFL